MTRPAALVTGASRGIGAAISLGLAIRGYEVFAVARTQRPGEGKLAGSLLETIGRIEDRGLAAHARPGDVSVPGFLEETLGNIVECSGQPPALVVHAAMIRVSREFIDLDLPTWRACVNANLDGVYLLTDACYRTMRGGSVVILTSGMADRSRSLPPGYLAYATAKAGVERYVAAVAPDLAMRDVAVNALRPGAVRTEFSESELGPNYDWSAWSVPSDAVEPVAVMAAYRPSRGDPTGLVIEARDLRQGAKPPS